MYDNNYQLTRIASNNALNSNKRTITGRVKCKAYVARKVALRINSLITIITSNQNR
jgi:hypothetical protein